MYKNIENYIKKCNVCQQIKTQHYRSYDEFIKFFISKKFWFEIFMNIIIQLLSSKYNDVIYNSIIIIICKYFKMTIYLLVKFTIIISQICDLFQNKIFLQYKLSNDIVFDKKNLFTSNFWSILYYCAKIKRRLNIAFYSQIDEQIERQNQILKQYLRCYCNYKQNDWIALFCLN